MYENEWQEVETEKKPAPPSPSEERERIKQRTAVREQLAAARHHQHVMRGLAEQLAAGKAALDQLALSHEQACQPLRETIERLEKKSIAALLEGKPINAKSDAERLAAAVEIREKTAAFEAELERQQDVLLLTEKAHFAAAQQAAEVPILERRVIHLAPRELQREMEAVGDHCQVLSQRLTGIRQRLAAKPSKYFEKVLSTTQQQFEQAVADRDRLYHECLTSND